MTERVTHSRAPNSLNIGGPKMDQDPVVQESLQQTRGPTAVGPSSDGQALEMTEPDATEKPKTTTGRSHLKTMTGCNNCKIRGVECDETQSQCTVPNACGPGESVTVSEMKAQKASMRERTRETASSSTEPTGPHKIPALKKGDDQNSSDYTDNGDLKSQAATTSSAIAPLANECLKIFQNLLDTSQKCHPDFEIDNVRTTIDEARARFKAWGINIAAFRSAEIRTSLDSRLSEAPAIRSTILQILEDLKGYLTESRLIVSGEKGNQIWNLDDASDSCVYSDDEDENSTSHNSKNPSLKNVVSNIDEQIKCIVASNSSLMRLSIIIRSSSTRDDYLKAASKYNTWSPLPDIGHVREKHGSAKQSTTWLIERLGRAITKRRQFLKYRVDHNDKMTGSDEVYETKREKPERTIMASTKATTYAGKNAIQIHRAPASDGGNSLTSKTSYEPTNFAPEGATRNLSVPSPPKFAFPEILFEYGEPFQCPYCFTEQVVKTKAAWKYVNKLLLSEYANEIVENMFFEVKNTSLSSVKLLRTTPGKITSHHHATSFVYASLPASSKASLLLQTNKADSFVTDLKPYVCTFEECSMAMFRSRNEWFAHETQNHRREWACQFCSLPPFSSASEFSNHITSSHGNVLRNSSLKALVLQSEEPVDKIPSTACPLCDEWEEDVNRIQQKLDSTRPKGGTSEGKTHGNLKVFRRHLGRHMEQLALFALPSVESEQLEDSSSGDVNASLRSHDEELAAELVSPADKSEDAQGGYGTIFDTAESTYIHHLAEFWQKDGTNILEDPAKNLTFLYRIRNVVESRGGYEKVCNRNEWDEIGQDLGYSEVAMSSRAISLETLYRRWLLPYETRLPRPELRQKSDPPRYLIGPEEEEASLAWEKELAQEEAALEKIKARKKGNDSWEKKVKEERMAAMRKKSEEETAAWEEMVSEERIAAKKSLKEKSAWEMKKPEDEQAVWEKIIEEKKAALRAQDAASSSSTPK
ncbi:hypothetical protein HYFRA_00003486 [Hymenoscyphus fraxineus]|uniref:ARID domain-containing protein n=1 Tax=Hymenoscyphus fraxineus TaxID=746836 RepID=A0A9N9KSV8_9HELO|nr:hypothetical protein HYFRA_00003486 [Hymenoscyphus fraxineus]